MSNMKVFRHKLTGKTGSFPDTDFYRNHPHMELVESGDSPEVVPSIEALTVVPKPKNNKKKEAKDE